MQNLAEIHLFGNGRDVVVTQIVISHGFSDFTKVTLPQ
jgi:hypothetical protein